MKRIDYLYYGLFFISILLILLAYKQYENSKNLLEGGIQTEAKVIELVMRKMNGKRKYSPVFEYTDKNHNNIRFESNHSSRNSPYHVGQTVTIVYSDITNERKVLSYWGLYSSTLLSLCLASILFIIGGGYILYLRDRSKRAITL